MATVIRMGALALGLTCASLGCYGAFEFAYRLEGAVTYLVLAAPVIGASAAVIPPIAETTWRGGHALKALLWWAVLLPAGAVVFFSAAERVHTAKAGAEAERSALRGAAISGRGDADQGRSRVGQGESRGQQGPRSEAVRSRLPDQAGG